MKKILRIFLLNFVISLSASSSLITFNCIYQGDTESFEPVGFIYWCKVNINATSPVTQRTTIHNITGVHGQNRQNTDVEGFGINEGFFNYLPSGLENSFANLIVLIVRKSSLMEISREDLAPFTKLRHLNLSRNKLRILEKNLFQHNKELEFLWLFGNEINFVDSHVFEDLKKVSFLNFFKNPKFMEEKLVVNGSLSLAQKSLAIVTEKCFDLSNDDVRVKRQVEEWNDNIEKCKNKLKEMEDSKNQLISQLNATIDQNLKEKQAMNVKLAEITMQKDYCEAEKIKNDAERQQNDVEINEKIQNLTSNVFQLESENLQWKNNFTNCEVRFKAENAKFQEEIENLQTKLKMKGEDNVNKSKEIANLQRIESENHQVIQNLTEKISNLEQKIINEAENFNEIHQNNTNVVQNLTNQILQLNELVLNKTDAINKLEAEISELKLQNLQKDAEISKIIAEKLDQNHTIYDRNQQILNQNQQIDDQKSQIIQLQEETDKINKSLMQNRIELDNSVKLHKNCETIAKNYLTSFFNCEKELKQCELTLKAEKANAKNITDEKNEIIANFTQVFNNCEQLKRNYTEIVNIIIPKTSRLKNREQSKNESSLLTQLDEQKIDVATSSFNFYIAIGFVALLCVGNAIAFGTIYCRKRSYIVNEMNLVNGPRYQGEQQGVTNPVFDNDTMGDIVEVDSSMEGLDATRRNQEETSGF